MLIAASGLIRIVSQTPPWSPNTLPPMTAAVAKISAHISGVATATNSTCAIRAAIHDVSRIGHSASASGIATKITVVAPGEQHLHQQ